MKIQVWFDSLEEFMNFNPGAQANCEETVSSDDTVCSKINCEETVSSDDTVCSKKDDAPAEVSITDMRTEVRRVATKLTKLSDIKPKTIFMEIAGVGSISQMNDPEILEKVKKRLEETIEKEEANA